MDTTPQKYHRGDIYYANLEPHLGCEQGGIRPVLVVQNDVGNKHSKTIIVSALTSRTATKAKLPTHVFLDHRGVFQLCLLCKIEHYALLFCTQRKSHGNH